MATDEKLKAWQLCHGLAPAIYAETDSWPKAELFGLTSQARRAAHPAGANIAEGWAKPGRPELGRYLNITLGSLGELSYTLRSLGPLPPAPAPIARISPHLYNWWNNPGGRA